MEEVYPSWPYFISHSRFPSESTDGVGSQRSSHFPDWFQLVEREEKKPLLSGMPQDSILFLLLFNTKFKFTLSHGCSLDNFKLVTDSQLSFC